MYYAVFHAVTALLIKNGLHAESHQGVSVLFSKHFVKEGKIDAEYGRLFARLENMREKVITHAFLKRPKRKCYQ